jgi:hypothetical protein
MAKSNLLRPSMPIHVDGAENARPTKKAKAASSIAPGVTPRAPCRPLQAAGASGSQPLGSGSQRALPKGLGLAQLQTPRPGTPRPGAAQATAAGAAQPAAAGAAGDPAVSAAPPAPQAPATASEGAGTAPNGGEVGAQVPAYSGAPRLDILDAPTAPLD